MANVASAEQGVVLIGDALKSAKGQRPVFIFMNSRDAPDLTQRLMDDGYIEPEELVYRGAKEDATTGERVVWFGVTAGPQRADSIARVASSFDMRAVQHPGSLAEQLPEYRVHHPLMYGVVEGFYRIF